VTAASPSGALGEHLPETPLAIIKKFVYDGQSIRDSEEPKRASVHATRSRAPSSK
jgi:hypothetical protein